MRKISLIIFILWLTGCASKVTLQDGPPHHYVDISTIHDAIPKKLPKSRYGNPETYTVYGKQYRVLDTAQSYDERGIASWYGTKFHGQLTSSREPYDMFAMTGASPVLQIPSFVRVTNLENHKSIVVKINDRGPFAPNRIIDLSYVAAKKLGYANKGTALVEVTALTEKHLASTLPNHPKLYLQLGAFRLLAHAEGLKTRIEAIIHKRVIIEKSLRGQLPLYKVRIGPLAGVGESDHIHAQLRKLRLGNPITIIS